MSGPVVILVRSQLAENIGACARAMLNCGLTEMRLVEPQADWLDPRARARSSGADEVLEGARRCDSIEEAVAGLQRVYATTWRPRDMVKRIVGPRLAAEEIRGLAGEGARSGVLFGPERTGLHSDDLALADAILEIPLNPAFPSLNLAQAVLLVAYECWMAGDATPPQRLHHGNSPLADRAAVANFMRHLERELDAAGFFHPPEKKSHMQRNLAALIARTDPTEQELRTLHGVVKSLVKGRFWERPDAAQDQGPA